MSEAMDQVATEVLADIMGVEVDEAPAEGEQPEEAAAPEAEAHEAEAEAVVNLDPELPEELANFLDEPDFEPTDEEVEAVVVEETNDDAEEWQEELDPEVAKLKKELAKERKRREHAEGLRLRSERSKWEKEAGRYFPLADLTAINATSRRGFLREAKKAHDTAKPRVMGYLEAERKRLAEEARVNAQKAWGKPLAGPGAPPSDAKAKQDEIEKARSTGSLQRVIKTMLKNENPL